MQLPQGRLRADFVRKDGRFVAGSLRQPEHNAGLDEDGFRSVLLQSRWRNRGLRLRQTLKDQDWLS